MQATRPKLWSSGLAAVATLAMVTTATSAGAQTRWSHNAPVAALDQIDGVATSNDEYRIWVYWTAQRFRIEYPDGRTAFDTQTLHEEDLAPRITLSYQTDGSNERLPGPERPNAAGRLPMHPHAPDVPSVMSLRYWLTTGLGQRRHAVRDGTGRSRSLRPAKGPVARRARIGRKPLETRERERERN